MKNNSKTKELITGSKNVVLLHSDLAKLNSKDKQPVETKNESKALYAKEFQFYEFYFLAVADKG